MLISIFTPLLAALTLAESVGPVGTPFFVPLILILFMLFLFGWGVVQRSWQITVYDQEMAASETETEASEDSSTGNH